MLADSAGVQPTAEEWQFIKMQHDTGVSLMRNALRIIDLPAFPLALILFSPLRQRAGDLAAGTLVVHGKTEEKREEPLEGDQRQKDEG